MGTVALSRPLLHRALARLDAENVEYCVLRDGESLDRLTSEREIDLLVRPAHLERLERELSGLGFVPRGTWGHSPHRFLVSYDPEHDVWVEIDVVDRIRFGRPTRSLDTSLHERVLADRRRPGEVWVPSMHDEFLTTLLHCVLDKRRFSERRLGRLADLAPRIDASVLGSDLASLGGKPEAAARILDLVRARDGEAVRNELAWVAGKLEAGDPWGTRGRRLRDRAARRVQRTLALALPRGVSVALLAPDGAGKSTLASGLVERFLPPVHEVYMGLYQRDSGTSGSPRLPGGGFVHRLLRQWRRYALARARLARGSLVVFDRYSFDALLAPNRRLSVGKRARRWILGRCCPAPDLTVILDAPAETLFARKHEQSVEILDRQRREYLRLRTRIPRCVVVDATRDPDSVHREVTSLLWERLAARSRRKRGGGP